MKHWVMAIAALVVASGLLHQFHKDAFGPDSGSAPRPRLGRRPAPLDDLQAHPDSPTTAPAIPLAPDPDPEVAVAPEAAPPTTPPIPM